MVELTRRSVESGSRPVDCPDFTRGAWKDGKGFPIVETDLSRLPGNFGDVKHDDNVEVNARQEGFI